MGNKKPRSYTQEDLLKLYLRLNGFFITGFIVHSPDFGKNRTEIDALAIRLPHNAEPERVLEPSPYLEPSIDLVDFLICEVKSKGQKLRFNDSLCNSLSAIESVLRWGGLFCEKEVIALAPEVQNIIQQANPSKQEIPMLLGPRKTRIRAILCSPERWNKRSNQPWFINGQEIFGYLWKCFCPDEPRSTCSTVYDFTAWGKSYDQLVRYFKDRKRKNQSQGTINDLYKDLGI